MAQQNVRWLDVLVSDVLLMQMRKCQYEANKEVAKPITTNCVNPLLWYMAVVLDFCIVGVKVEVSIELYAESIYLV